MAVTYCTAAQVASFLNISTPDGSSDPTLTEVEGMINENEDYIDMVTGHAWRSVTVTDEIHSMENYAFNISDGVSISLHHRKITAFQSGTDKIEIWDGSQDLDYVANKNEGRDKDFWVDLTNGRVFIKTFPRSLPRFFGAKITYRYGESSVPGDIQKACKLLTAKDLVENDDKSLLLPEGSSNVPLLSKAERWLEEAEKIIMRRKEYKVLAA